MSRPFYEGPTPWTDSHTNKFGEVFAGRVLTQQLERRMRAAAEASNFLDPSGKLPRVDIAFDTAPMRAGQKGVAT